MQTVAIAQASPEAVLAKAGSAQVTRTALNLFFGICERWELTLPEQRRLLGEPPERTFYKWRTARAGTLSNDVLERISYLAGIHKALGILLPNDQDKGWVKRPNAAFGGRSALQRMLGGRVVDLSDVRRYLDAVRGG